MTVYLRPGRPTDAGRTGEILWEHAQTDMSAPDLFSCAEAIACCGQMIDNGWVTVAIADDRIEAFLARAGGEIESLYVARTANRMGLGKLLLADAMERCETLHLSVHPDNGGAQRFYRRQGFREAPGPTQSSGRCAEAEIRMCWQREQDK